MQDNLNISNSYIDNPPISSGTIIKFIDYDRDNKIFTAIGDQTIRFPYSLLNAFFIKDSGRCVYCCTLRVDGCSYQIFQLSAEELWELVRDRSFKVVVDNNVYQLLGLPSQTLSYEIRAKLLNIFKLKDSGKLINTDNMLSVSSCYQFEQIQ